MPQGRSAVHLEELPPSFDLMAALARLRDEGFAWCLESSLRDARRGRWSFAGASPDLVVRARGARVEIECRRAQRPGWRPGRSAVLCDPLELLRELMPAPPPLAPLGPEIAAQAPPFLGGAVGFFGYELAEETLPVRLHGWDDLGVADLVFLFGDRLVAVDHAADRAFAIGWGFAEGEAEAARRARDAAGELAASLSGAALPVEAGPAPAPRAAAVLPRALEAHFDESAYAKAVSAILDEIAAGNCYQADLTQRLELPFPGDAFDLYRALRRSNPAPFASFLELPEVAVVGSSPERFLRVDPDGRVESRPIKGTRPRGASPQEDGRLERELADSAKDRAENLMIVDLVRNDLGRVCEPGSIGVPELQAIERYAGVFQMVSSVTGRLASGKDALDLVRAAFPPGSMTGAPKLAAMRILDRLEPVRRGVYSGALGYLDARGGCDLSVVIRTLLLAGGRAYLHVGGGVVADSDPVAEYRETLDKARPLLAALEAACRS